MVDDLFRIVTSQRARLEPLLTMFRKFLFAVAFSAAAAAAPRVAFVRTIAPLHNLGGSEVVIIYALGDTPKLDTFLDTFLDRTNRSEKLRIAAQLQHIKSMRGESPDRLTIQRLRREHPADVFIGVNHFTCATRQSGAEGSEHTTGGERIRKHHFWADAVCKGRMDVIDPATGRLFFSFDLRGEGTSPRVTEVTEEERNIAAEQAAHFAAVQAAEMVTPRRIKESIELDARAPEMERAMLLLDAGRLMAARNLWKRELDRSPDSAPLHFNVAAVSEAMGEVDVAREHYRAAVRLAPKERWYQLEARMFERRTSGAR
jgi:tetratricopeptide (TPR) repeat protein